MTHKPRRHRAPGLPAASCHSTSASLGGSRATNLHRPLPPASDARCVPPRRPSAQRGLRAPVQLPTQRQAADVLLPCSTRFLPGCRAATGPCTTQGRPRVADRREQGHLPKQASPFGISKLPNQVKATLCNTSPRLSSNLTTTTNHPTKQAL